MQMHEYQLEAVKTVQPNVKLEYLAGKLAVEAAEAFQHVLKHVHHGKPLDKPAVIDELGDVLWYVTMMAHEMGYMLETVAAQNVTKLRARHGEKYNQAHYAAKATTGVVPTIITFGENDIDYGQDFRFFRGIPAGIAFTVTNMGDRCRLYAPGYGSQPYGNGALSVSTANLIAYAESIADQAAE